MCLLLSGGFLFEDIIHCDCTLHNQTFKGPNFAHGIDDVKCNDFETENLPAP